MSAQYVCPEGHIRCVVDLGECPVCHKKLIIESQADWIDRLLADEKLWIIDRVASFPEVISSEYLRLHQLMQEKKVYGAYYKIKDLIEAVLKFYILSICAWSSAKKNKVFNKSVLPLITTPNLSLGSWLALGNKITSFYRSSNEHVPEILIEGLEKVIRFYQRHNFVNWRNEKIAHGALALSDTTEFQSDVEQKLTEFIDLFSEIGGSLEKIRLVNIRNENKDPVTIVLLPQMTKFTAEPFFCKIENEIYFFDNQKNEKCTKLQCYKTGSIETRIIPFFSELRKILIEKKIDQDESINEKYRSLEEERALDSVGIDTEFIEPEFITDWLSNQVATLSKGVFSLEMSRGMGKSMYTERISTLQKNPVCILPELEVRTYHVTRSQLLGKADFETAIETQWVTDYHNNIWIGAPRFKDFEHQTENASEAFVLFLKECLRYTKKKHDKSKILMVIDGLDEINDMRIWEYLPSEEQLPDNIYLLLTFRNTETDILSPAIVGHLQGVDITKKLLVDARTDQYMQFMRAYIDSMIKNIPAEAKDSLIELSDYKMLNLAPVCKLVKYGYPVKGMNSTEDILTAYWNEIKKQYGTSEFSHFMDIASFFCLYNDESVSINDLAYLYYNGTITYGLLGILSDMMPFLSVERGYYQNGTVYQGENRYCLTNGNISDILKSLIPDYKEVVHSSLFTVVEEISVLAKKEPNTIPYSEDDLVVFAHSMSHQKNIKDLILSIGETETRLFGKDDQGVLIKEDIDQAVTGYNEFEALALVLTQPVDILYKHHEMGQKPGIMEHSVIRFLQKLETVAKMQVKQHLFKASVQMCTIYDGLSLSDSDYFDYYQLIRIIAGLFVLEGSYESAIRKYIQLLDKASLSHRAEKLDLIQKHVLIDVAEIYIRMEKFSDAQKCYNTVLGMNNKKTNDISLAAYTGLLKTQLKTGDMDSAIIMVGNIKEILMDGKSNRLLESDYHYFTLYCEACFEYIRFLNIIEKEDPDIDFYQSCEATIDMIMTLVLNLIESAHRNSRLQNYDLLIELYMLDGHLHLKPHKLDKLDYTDWAIIYFQQVLKLYNKARQNGEHVDQKEYNNLLDLIKKLMKRVNKSSPSYFHAHHGGNVVSKKVDVNSPNSK